MITQSAFFEDAHKLCGSKICSIRNVVKSQPQNNYHDALGIGTDIQDDDDIFEGEQIAPVTPTTITRRTKNGTLELIKGWQAIIRIPGDKQIISKSRITLQDDENERVVLKWARSVTEPLYAVVLS